MVESIEVREAERPDAPEIAEIHLAARRREAMPYLNQAHTDQEARDWFARVVGDRLAAWWVAQVEHEIGGYMRIVGENLTHFMCGQASNDAASGCACSTRPKP
jgi:L-amino acid N-acyltransferase YncA